ncbi:MAG: hypothetical protein PHW96_01570 [Candidatus Nanoarchaeia archaeon]|nr:hypothetical protein [Candidatus Nanoarchaeia archaeon]
MAIRISDVPVFDMCPVMYYFQKIKKYIPLELIKRMNKGTLAHEKFEKEQKEIHDSLPEPEDGKPYIYLFQEQKMHDKELNLTGRADQIILKGSALNKPFDKRMFLVVDKKPRFNQSYLYQLWGYAYLSNKNEEFEKYKPFTLHTAFAYQTIDEIFPYEEHHEKKFIQKVNELRSSHAKMLEGQIPKILYTEKCANCFYRDKCSGLFKEL